MFKCEDCGYQTSKTERLGLHMKERRHGNCRRKSNWKGDRRVTKKAGAKRTK